MTPLAGAAWLAGLASILSPCVLPLVPTYVLYLGGTAAQTSIEPRSGRFSWSVMGHALLFVVGFSVIFIAFGLSATGIGMLLLRHQLLLQHLAGIVVTAFGLTLMGILRIPGLNRDWHWVSPRRGRSPSHSLLLGMAFSAGWTPCVGPVLGSILAIAAQSSHWMTGATLLGWYSLGLAIPFLAMAVAMSRVQPWIRRMTPWLPWIQRISGVLVTVLGIMVYFGIFSRLAALFST